MKPPRMGLMRDAGIGLLWGTACVAAHVTAYADISTGSSDAGTGTGVTNPYDIGGSSAGTGTATTEGSTTSSGAGSDTGGGSAAGSGTSRNQTSLGDSNVETLQLNNTMNFNDCHQYSASPGMKMCILLGFKNTKDNFCRTPPKPISCIMSYDYKFNYWEPSELIEVSCRKGYSMLKPGGVGQVSDNQSCFSYGSGAGKRWFFDARVWAINGKDGAARAQAAGGRRREQTVACGANGPFGGLNQLEGYGKKFKMFNQGAASGPGQSWEAYISDYDTSWSVDSNGGSAASAPPTQNKCAGTDIASCWGPEQPLSGWVSHPHQPVAAALAGWRAHTKAQGKVSPALSEGYKINLDYPFIMRTSPFGKSMGLQAAGGSGGAGGNLGSRCFQPGDPGPWWYTDNQRRDTSPEQMPGIIQGLKDADTAGVGATLHTGVYVFTYWVKTSCELFAGIFGTNVQAALNGCADKQDY